MSFTELIENFERKTKFKNNIFNKVSNTLNSLSDEDLAVLFEKLNRRYNANNYHLKYAFENFLETETTVIEYKKRWLYRDWAITLEPHTFYNGYHFEYIGGTSITKIKTYNSEEVYKTLMSIFKHPLIVFLNVFIIRENFKINSVSYKFYTKVLNLVFPKLNNQQQINLYNHLKENL